MELYYFGKEKLITYSNVSFAIKYPALCIILSKVKKWKLHFQTCLYSINGKILQFSSRSSLKKKNCIINVFDKKRQWKPAENSNWWLNVYDIFYLKLAYYRVFDFKKSHYIQVQRTVLTWIFIAHFSTC